MNPVRPYGIAFLCVGNSARSQMAEGLARDASPPGYRFFSAGSQPSGLHPLATRVLAEMGIDISNAVSKSMHDLPWSEIHLAITLCAEEACPLIPFNIPRLHWPFPDPVSVPGEGSSSLDGFRRVRDGLRARLHEFFANREFPPQGDPA